MMLNRRQEQQSRMRTNPALLRNRRAFILLLILSLGIFFFGAIHVVADTGWPNGGWMTHEDVKIEAYCIIDGDTGQVIMEHNADVRRANASTTKIMTALTLVNDKNYDPDRILHVSDHAVNLTDPNSARIKGLKGGDKIRTLDAMAALLIASANDVARVIAQNYGGYYGAIDPSNANNPELSQQSFAKNMNILAWELGLENTSFTNSAGFDERDQSHYTTARDLATITFEAMKHPQIAHIVGMQRYRLPPDENHKDPFWAPMSNSNGLVAYGADLLDSQYFARYTGVKTGTTPQAGKCLVGSGVTHDGRKIICVALGIAIPEMYADNSMYGRAIPVRALMEEGARRLGCPAIERRVNFLAPTTVPTPTTPDDTPSNSEGKDHDQYNTSSPGAISTTPDSTSGNGVGVLASVRALPVVLQILMILGLLAVLFLIKWLIVSIVRNLKRGRRRRRR